MPGHTRIAIVGGGLAGLRLAVLLQQRGVQDFAVLEARAACGGRVVTEGGGFDLGATWFWPDMQPELAGVIAELQLQVLPQHEDGDLVLERSATLPPQRISGYVSAPPSMRLVGGMARLVQAHASLMASDRIRCGCRVRRLVLQDDGVELHHDQGVWHARHVALALPPRLAMQSIEFSPSLPETASRSWRATNTWMAPHAKYLAAYDEPFWRAQGLSGAARSGVGPMGEISDATDPQAGAALFGFLGVSASARLRVPAHSMKSLCRAQLVRLFGDRAAHPRAEWLKDWAQDDCTATGLDQAAGHEHPHPPAPVPQPGAWQGRLVGVASEWSPLFPGYLAGALDAARRGADWLLEQEGETR